ncbi:hypothetical protein BaRGS_00008444, partial [Batillaria attramentaria]
MKATSGKASAVRHFNKRPGIGAVVSFGSATRLLIRDTWCVVNKELGEQIG